MTSTLSPATPKPSYLGETFRTFAKYPFIFLILEFPGIIPELISEFCLGKVEQWEILYRVGAITGFIWLTLTTSFWSLAATLFAIDKIRKGQTPHLGEAAAFATSHLPKLIVAALIMGIVVGAGLAAYIIPGVILISLYLFVPFFLTAGDNPSIMTAFNRSWKLVIPSGKLFSLHHLVRYARTLALVFVVVAVCLAMDLAGTEAKTWIRGSGDDKFPLMLAVFGQLLIARVVGTVANVLLACYFKSLKTESEGV